MGKRRTNYQFNRMVGRNYTLGEITRLQRDARTHMGPKAGSGDRAALIAAGAVAASMGVRVASARSYRKKLARESAVRRAPANGKRPMARTRSSNPSRPKSGRSRQRRNRKGQFA